MRQLPLSIVAFAFSTVSLAQTGVIAVEHADGSPTSFYYMPSTSLNEVLTAHVADDDTVYLPGGTMSFSNMTLNTKVTLVGAGFHQNGVPVTQKTVIPDVAFGLIIGTGANSSSFHGIDFECDVNLASSVDGISFTRCEFGSLSLNPAFSSDPTSIQFKHCLLRNGAQGGSSGGLAFDNCILEGSLTFDASASGNFIRHCLFLNANLSGGSAQSVTYTDNIFIFSTSTPTVTNVGHFYNNVFASPNGSAPTYGSGNYQNNQLALSSSLFVAGTSLTTFDYSDNYTPLPNSIAVTMTSYDGTDAGIYGGLSGAPWKPLAIPYNPHWEQLVVPPGTVGGVLQGVQLQGSAQSN